LVGDPSKPCVANLPAGDTSYPIVRSRRRFFRGSAIAPARASIAAPTSPDHRRALEALREADEPLGVVDLRRAGVPHPAVTVGEMALAGIQVEPIFAPQSAAGRAPVSRLAPDLTSAGARPVALTPAPRTSGVIGYRARRRRA